MRKGPVLKVFLIFAFLQVADLGTTIAALRLGGTEQNPVVQHLMAVGTLNGVILAKVIALAIGLGCFLASKRRALRIANVVFAGIVLWNVTILFRLI